MKKITNRFEDNPLSPKNKAFLNIGYAMGAITIEDGKTALLLALGATLPIVLPYACRAIKNYIYPAKKVSIEFPDPLNIPENRPDYLVAQQVSAKNPLETSIHHLNIETPLQWATKDTLQMNADVPLAIFKFNLRDLLESSMAIEEKIRLLTNITICNPAGRSITWKLLEAWCLKVDAELLDLETRYMLEDLLFFVQELLQQL